MIDSTDDASDCASRPLGGRPKGYKKDVPITLEAPFDKAQDAQTDLDHLITWTAAVAATHHDWWRLRQLFLATFMAERMTVEFPELVTEWSLNR